MIIFLYNLYIVWIWHDCLANMVFALDLSNSVIRRLWFIVHIIDLASKFELEVYSPENNIKLMLSWVSLPNCTSTGQA